MFGPPPSSPPEYAALKQHGFARSEVWKVDKILLDNEDGVSVRFAPPPTPASFPHKFELFYVVTLAPHQLVCDVHVKNTGSEDFKFQALLHSYLAVPDATKVSITGIDAGVTYKDKILGGETGTAPGGALVVDRPLDRCVVAELALTPACTPRSHPSRSVLTMVLDPPSPSASAASRSEQCLWCQLTTAALCGTLAKRAAARWPTWKKADG